MRIWNVELDQYRDRVKIESPVACTGVSHVYYAIEHMLLDDNDVKGLSARSGKFHKRAYVEGSLLRRLDGENLLGRETAATLKRHTYTTAAAKELADVFHDRYGQFLTASSTCSSPSTCTTRLPWRSRSRLQGHTNPQIRTILFEGQNVGRTFSDYLDYMVDEERKAKNSPLASGAGDSSRSWPSCAAPHRRWRPLARIYSNVGPNSTSRHLRQEQAQESRR